MSNHKYIISKRIYLSLIGVWVFCNVLLIAFSNAPVRWEIFRFLRDNLSWLLLGSVSLFASVFIWRIVVAVRFGRRELWRILWAGAKFFGLAVVQVVFLWLIAVSNVEFMCTSSLAHRHRLDPYGESIVFIRHDCIPDGDETVYIQHRYSPFLTEVGFLITPVAAGHHTGFYRTEGTRLYVEFGQKTVVYDLEAGKIVPER